MDELSIVSPAISIKAAPAASDQQAVTLRTGPG